MEETHLMFCRPTYTMISGYATGQHYKKGYITVSLSNEMKYLYIERNVL